uniref:Ribosomal large subunit pseudouridine synthase B n=1 Tax=Candidatus Kentrum sp. LPFa TaxID=2126335 RepID=A0A450XD94_9GAMM|nr:MAG: ribosomal large subunit pseudouridine synthase B [Candidatus Kentron sp. LPFa]VFK27256.1 MAG: ribosomal large subunit pseudouridine synthase B [Candidatus Kentron sp. LPFa]
MGKTPRIWPGRSKPEFRRRNAESTPTARGSASVDPKHYPSEKLQKVLAEVGLGSRRLLEGWIEAGRVTVNGVKAQLGARVGVTDKIRVDGREIFRSLPGAERVRVLRYHKPVGEICSRADPEGRSSVFDRLPDISRGRWIAIGRLDINTCGLLLFTNRGELANRLMHPSSGMEREYAVRVLAWDSKTDTARPGRNLVEGRDNRVAPDVMERLRKGVRLEDGIARFENIVDVGGQGRNHWYHVTIKEGKTHEVRRLWEAVGLRVSRLIRVRYGPIRLQRELHPGHWEELSAKETEGLARSVGLGGLVDSAPPRSQRPRSTGYGRRNAAGQSMKGGDSRKERR